MKRLKWLSLSVVFVIGAACGDEKKQDEKVVEAEVAEVMCTCGEKTLGNMEEAQRLSDAEIRQMREKYFECLKENVDKLSGVEGDEKNIYRLANQKCPEVAKALGQQTQ